MTARPASKGLAQAWVELLSEDPAAQSALQAIRAHLSEGRGLRRLRRARLYEIRGGVPARARLEALLHRSTQFYNPHKEACRVRRAARDRLPVEPGDTVVLVWERDGERRAAAERWLLRETRRALQVREVTAWVLEWTDAVAARDRLRATAELAEVRDRRHGLLANPHAQDVRVLAGELPLPALPVG